MVAPAGGVGTSAWTSTALNNRFSKVAKGIWHFFPSTLSPCRKTFQKCNFIIADFPSALYGCASKIICVKWRKFDVLSQANENVLFSSAQSQVFAGQIFHVMTLVKCIFQKLNFSPGIHSVYKRLAAQRMDGAAKRAVRRKISRNLIMLLKWGFPLHFCWAIHDSFMRRPLQFDKLIIAFLHKIMTQMVYDFNAQLARKETNNNNRNSLHICLVLWKGFSDQNDFFRVFLSVENRNRRIIKTEGQRETFWHK